MDLDRLTLAEVAQISKLIVQLGMPAAPDELDSCVRILDATATLYRKQLIMAHDASRAHGEG